jgi:hypothetical protein
MWRYVYDRILTIVQNCLKIVLPVGQVHAYAPTEEGMVLNLSAEGSASVKAVEVKKYIMRYRKTYIQRRNLQMSGDALSNRIAKVLLDAHVGQQDVGAPVFASPVGAGMGLQDAPLHE